MKLTLSWLKEHLDTEAGVDAIAEQLTALGLEVEGVEDKAAALAPFTVGHVVRCEQHPNADRLKVCHVDTGSGEVQVVCGAPNARQGMKGVFAPAGTYIPGTDMTLKKGVIRGIDSNGMLCSEREMGLSDEHTGIIDLPEDAPVGAPFAEIMGLNDPVIDIGLTPDRGDCAGIRGIARDLAASGIGTLRDLPANPVAGRFKSPIGVALKLPKGKENACPMFVGRYVRGVKNGPSPRWLQEKLRAVGLRPISTLVDVTNYFTMDRGRPLHVFDADTVAGGIHVRLSKAGETLDALNDKSYTLDDEVCVIADDDGVLALGGIVGGTASGCTEETVNVFVEAALFDPVRTAASGRKLQIDSDARYRFERGVDPEAVISGMEQATTLIQELCGGEASELVVAGAVPDWRRTLPLRPSRVEHLGGVAVPLDEQVRILTALGFGVTEDKDGVLQAEVPSWRSDVHGEADLVEEVLRVNGFDKIPPVSMPRLGALTRPAITAKQRASTQVRRLLAARGMEEAVTWSFMESGLAARFGFQNTHLKLLNPIASDLDAMRPSILPNLIQAAARNTDRGLSNGALFEIGPVYRDTSPKGQSLVATGIRAGEIGERHWASKPRPADAMDAKADAIAVLTAAGAPVGNCQVTTDAPDWYHPGRSGCLRLGPNVLAVFGEIHPAVLAEMDAPSPVAAFEVFLDNVPQPKSAKKATAKPLLKLSPFQPLERDFAFVVDQTVAADDLVRAAKGGDKALIADVGVFDLYQGKGVEDGKKSVAITVTLQPIEATLTDEQIEAVSAKIVANVVKRTGGTLRG